MQAVTAGSEITDLITADITEAHLKRIFRLNEHLPFPRDPVLDSKLQSIAGREYWLAAKGIDVKLPKEHQRLGECIETFWVKDILAKLERAEPLSDQDQHYLRQEVKFQSGGSLCAYMDRLEAIYEGEESLSSPVDFEAFLYQMKALIWSENHVRFLLTQDKDFCLKLCQRLVYLNRYCELRPELQLYVIFFSRAWAISLMLMLGELASIMHVNIAELAQQLSELFLPSKEDIQLIIHWIGLGQEPHPSLDCKPLVEYGMFFLCSLLEKNINTMYPYLDLYFPKFLELFEEEINAEAYVISKINPRLSAIYFCLRHPDFKRPADAPAILRDVLKLLDVRKESPALEWMVLNHTAVLTIEAILQHHPEIFYANTLLIIPTLLQCLDQVLEAQAVDAARADRPMEVQIVAFLTDLLNTAVLKQGLNAQSTGMLLKAYLQHEAKFPDSATTKQVLWSTVSNLLKERLVLLFAVMQAGQQEEAHFALMTLHLLIHQFAYRPEDIGHEVIARAIQPLQGFDFASVFLAYNSKNAHGSYNEEDCILIAQVTPLLAHYCAAPPDSLASSAPPC